jgi:hypothetical protein
MQDSNIQLLCLALAVLRIYLEVISYDLENLPLTKKLMNPTQAQSFHRWGFFISCGFLITQSFEIFF